MIIEFDNYYRAVFVGAREQKRKPRTHFNRPWDIKYLFTQDNNLRITKINGALIPFCWRILRYFPPIIHLNIEKITRFFHFKYFAGRLFVRAEKIKP